LRLLPFKGDIAEKRSTLLRFFHKDEIRKVVCSGADAQQVVYELCSGVLRTTTKLTKNTFSPFCKRAFTKSGFEKDRARGSRKARSWRHRVFQQTMAPTQFLLQTSRLNFSE